MRKRVWLLLLLASALSVLGAAANAGYSVDWFSVDGGGGESTGGSYQLEGSIGQPDAHGAASGGTYQVEGGFWYGAGTGTHVYLPLIVKP